MLGRARGFVCCDLGYRGGGRGVGCFRSFVRVLLCGHRQENVLKNPTRIRQRRQQQSETKKMCMIRIDILNIYRIIIFTSKTLITYLEHIITGRVVFNLRIFGL